MTEVTLHATPRGRDVVLEQIRALGLSLRRDALVVAVVLGIVTVFIAMDIVRGRAATWFDSDDWAVLGIAAFLFPFAVWRRENRFGPALLWTFPVDRRRLALAKVFGGWVWLMIALTIVFFWQVALAAVSGVAGAETVSLQAFPGMTAAYLFGSALVLGLRHPLRWLLGTFSVLLLLGFFNEAIDRMDGLGLNRFLTSDAVSSAIAASQQHPYLAWAITTFLWIGAGLAALWAAASRHGEHRRH
jgi:hypothetical protein